MVVGDATGGWAMPQRRVLPTGEDTASAAAVPRLRARLNEGSSRQGRTLSLRGIASPPCSGLNEGSSRQGRTLEMRLACWKAMRSLNEGSSRQGRTRLPRLPLSDKRRKGHLARGAVSSGRTRAALWRFHLESARDKGQKGASGGAQLP